MASRLLHRLKRSLFKDGEAVGPEPEVTGDGWEAELEEEEECVTDRLGGKLCFDSGQEEGAEDEDEGSGQDSNSDILGESMEEGLSSTDTSPSGPPSTRDSWRTACGGSEVSPSPTGRRATDSLLFEVTDASIMRDGASKYVLYTIHVIQAGGSDKTPAVITRRYSEFQKLHVRLCRHHGEQMERVHFPRKKLRSNFTAETIGKRSRAFEQYLSHLCSMAALQGALCVRQFFYLPDLQAGQTYIRAERYQDALGPLLNAKRLQQKLGWTALCDNQPPTTSSHWLYTLVALLSCFQEVEQLEEARDHCQHALCAVIPAPRLRSWGNSPRRPQEEPQALSLSADAFHFSSNRPHPLLLPLAQVMVRLSWQTGTDKRQWEELLHNLEEEEAGVDNEPTIREFLLQQCLEESEGEAGARWLTERERGGGVSVLGSNFFDETKQNHFRSKCSTVKSGEGGCRGF
ncbi:sorting nexin-21 [Takifugu rubripes]|uniref:Sorting nexin family member 21 n=1 Tax=Takifugu rubripes TaxID=31033 RepID=A0A674P6C9_TAKRU|nr:sorting nexin-21 [Takifugu rubripes]XP_029689662.1 sorting nexin-21 [Takifugu rubripes]